MADANTTAAPDPVKAIHEAQDTVVETLANLDCLFLLNSMGHVDSLMDGTFSTVLGNALIHLKRVDELLDHASALTYSIQHKKEGGAA
jgi:hypothetical protein